MDKVILFAVPVFFLLIGIEVWIDMKRGGKAYRLADSLCSLSIGSLSQITGFFTAMVSAAIYVFVYRHLALFDLPEHGWPVWLAAILAYDFCYYWNHRCGHELNLLWAAHVVHHSSEEYNLSTALRQSSTGFLFGWAFYLPMAVAGFPPMVTIGAGLINLLYQYWIHTRHIGRLGWFDYVFASPSNHRVHHGQNDYCIDRNYGGLLMLWDHLFGSFAAERDGEEIVYGIRGPLASFDPVWANLHYYALIAREIRLAAGWRDRLRMLAARPGWRPAAAALRAPKPDWRLADFVPYRPGFNAIGAGLAFFLFVLLLAGTVAFMGLAAAIPAAASLAAALALSAGYWGLGRRLSKTSR
jgi:alkylglycerol monooxygenase